MRPVNRTIVVIEDSERSARNRLMELLSIDSEGVENRTVNRYNFTEITITQIAN